MTPTEKREKLAIMLMCRSYLYYSNILTEQEANKVFERIRKFQDKNKIEISDEQINSVDFIYKDKRKGICDKLKQKGD